MGLPLNLAMTASEIAGVCPLPKDFAWMACHFSPDGEGLTNLPDYLPDGSLLILNDSNPCRNHDIRHISKQLQETVAKFRCCGLLLDFQRPFTDYAASVAAALAQSLPCPVAVPPQYAAHLPCPVFLPPAPLHQPMESYLKPWQNREIWLEAALCQERITVTKEGTSFASIFPAQPQDRGFYQPKLRCCYRTAVSHDAITFTLFDTQDTLYAKLELAAKLGVTRTVGLYQELAHFPK
jgi:hypothetical protein